MRLSDVAAVLTIIVAIIAISTFLAGLWSIPSQEPTPQEHVPPEPEPQEHVPPEPEPQEHVPPEPEPQEHVPPEPEPQEHVPPEPEPPEPEHSITVRVNTYPRTIMAGESTEISVIALSGDVPVPGANVKISAGGGFFEDTGNVITTGITDDEGVFRTIWHTYEKSAYTGEMSYVFSVDVSKSSYESGYGKGEVFITI
jgi:hypothetical protein